MQFIDPFPVACETCCGRGVYPVATLRACKAHCTHCGARLVKAATGINNTLRDVAINIWPLSFLWEAFDKFDVDLDDITDDEFDELADVLSLRDVLLRLGRTDGMAAISELSIMQKLNATPEAANLLSYSLKELALLANPVVSIG